MPRPVAYVPFPARPHPMGLTSAALFLAALFVPRHDALLVSLFSLSVLVPVLVLVLVWWAGGSGSGSGLAGPDRVNPGTAQPTPVRTPLLVHPSIRALPVSPLGHR